MSTHQNSLFAYDKSKVTGPERRRMVYRYLLQRGGEGATDDEVIHNTTVEHASMAGTRHQLMKLGAVLDTGNTRPTRSGNPATIWIAVPGIDVSKSPGKTGREVLLTNARKKLKGMSDEELREFIADPTATEPDSGLDILDFYEDFRE
jgi:hypothetical protein